jgi:hypothetical protein
MFWSVLLVPSSTAAHASDNQLKRRYNGLFTFRHLAAPASFISKHAIEGKGKTFSENKRIDLFFLV